MSHANLCICAIYKYNKYEVLIAYAKVQFFIFVFCTLFCFFSLMLNINQIIWLISNFHLIFDLIMWDDLSEWVCILCADLTWSANLLISWFADQLICWSADLTDYLIFILLNIFALLAILEDFFWNFIFFNGSANLLIRNFYLIFDLTLQDDLTEWVIILCAELTWSANLLIWGYADLLISWFLFYFVIIVSTKRILSSILSKLLYLLNMKFELYTTIKSYRYCQNFSDALYYVRGISTYKDIWVCV